MEPNSKGQDEDIDDIEITMVPLGKLTGDDGEPKVVSCSRQAAMDLGSRLRKLPPEVLRRSPDDVEPFVVTVSGLSPNTTYSCTARALTHAGGSSPSSPSTVVTRAVPPG
jgi:hypothetical protein